MLKQKIGIIYGGRSTEHEISIRSALNVSQFLDKDRFEPVHIGISVKGKWCLMPDVTDNFENGHPLTLKLDASDKGLFTQDNVKVEVDLYFPVLHGTDGEDGSIQGLLTAMEMPFIGTGVLGSSLCMSKLISKQLLQASGIPVVPFEFVMKDGRDSISYSALKEKLGLPFMVKAANLGSSVGINKVKDEDGFEKAVDEAFKYDTIIIFEKFIKGRELECAVIGNQAPQASLAGEIVIDSQYEFYTYKAKYLDPDAVKLEVPAAIDQEIHEEIQEYSIKAYKVLHCEDFSRVDIFLSEGDKVYINEINTIPGFTNASMFPMMWEERGISYKNLITKLIEIALERYRLNQKQREYQVIN